MLSLMLFREHQRLLRDQADASAQSVQIEGTQILTIESHGAFARIVEAQYQGWARVDLPQAARTDNRQRLPGADR